MIGEWIRFILSAVCILAGTFTLIVSIVGVYIFDFALRRIHATAIADTLALFLFIVGIMIATGAHFVTLKLAFVLLLQWCTSPLASHMLAQLEYRADQHLAEHVELPEDEEVVE